MLEAMASRIAQGMINAGSVPIEDKEIYVYGWSLILSELAGLIVMFSIGLIAGQLAGTLIFLIAFTIVRIYAGGYHANSYAGCFFISNLLYLISLLAVYCIPAAWIGGATAFLLAVSALITWTWAPMDHPNKPQNREQKAKNRKISRILLSAEILLICLIGISLPQLRPLLLWASLGLAMTSLTLLLLIIQPYSKGGKSVES